MLVSLYSGNNLNITCNLFAPKPEQLHQSHWVTTKQVMQSNANYHPIITPQWLQKKIDQALTLEIARLWMVVRFMVMYVLSDSM